LSQDKLHTHDAVVPVPFVPTCPTKWVYIFNLRVFIKE